MNKIIVLLMALTVFNFGCEDACDCPDLCTGVLRVGLLNYDLPDMHLVYFDVSLADEGTVLASGSFLANSAGDSEPAYAMSGDGIYVFQNCGPDYDLHVYVDEDDSYDYSSGDTEYWERGVSIFEDTLVEVDYSDFAPAS